MTTQTKPRRIRVCQCLHCGNLFKWQRRGPNVPTDDETQLALQNCPHCYMMSDGDRIPSTLENSKDYPSIK